ncbi:hypothetical protein E2986_12954 [Frieseomelitta varia]|uniref:Uncharacterized protein n=1 Tax=Frieseomelitta varia TaxID=561572 RepID=A0A833RKX2_9HYME|nr:hypothetical protein E2986_12954 [Frieseomelitta varia]
MPKLKVGDPTDAIVAVLCTGCLCLHVYKVSKEWCCSCCFGNFTRITSLRHQIDSNQVTENRLHFKERELSAEG